MEKLYNYIFHYNNFTEQWAAIPREKYNEYWNNKDERVNTGILYAKDHSTLVEFLSSKIDK